MSEPFIGQIALFGFSFAPMNWAKCDGQILQISQNNALFALIGTTYGGNGSSTFGLPDLRGRTAIHQGTGTGLTPRTIGDKDGKEQVVLQADELPAHSHTVTPKAVDAVGTATSPVGAVFAKPQSQRPIYEATPVTKVDMAAMPTGITGGSVGHQNMPPFLVVNFCISLFGIFPTRD